MEDIQHVTSYWSFKEIRKNAWPSLRHKGDQLPKAAEDYGTTYHVGTGHRLEKLSPYLVQEFLKLCSAETVGDLLEHTDKLLARAGVDPVVMVHVGTNDIGNINRNCTAEGWSEVFPNITSICGSEATQDKLVFYTVVKTLYTLGHSLSLIALTTGSAILCLFRKLHCTRNYIHLNLFFSFMLRAVAVLVKDDILFSHSTQCSDQPSLIGCKASLVIFQYFIMANFFWLLVEGLYLHTLLMVIFSENRHFIVYLLIGWGFPTVFVFAWTMTRIYLEDTGCWEINENAIPMWVINSPIMFSIMVNFILFISIIRILVQKLRCPDVGGNDQSQYRRLAKSTLLLIPLFGVHYVVFVSLNEAMADYKIFFDLALGSFQGLVVAILYCFLNSEVQCELKRKWESVCLNCHMSRAYQRRGSSSYRNATETTVL
ncbi:hypothetical protein AAFF_G00245350 [Aldrovandia affinis]|uniref:G-protein coupled receptors family 2 profile 2 domain-containing protein n=1 Tax=Aldrovandia affinis TaxID=143900 RepID=A0AAD7W460_9TELE|nr:hypothetical protein AAFF_G00245350 [Aldrovandia affinis]